MDVGDDRYAQREGRRPVFRRDVIARDIKQHARFDTERIAAEPGRPDEEGARSLQKQPAIQHRLEHSRPRGDGRKP